MCGIAGVFNLTGEPVDPVTLRAMAQAIRHRGPDSEGFYVDSFVGLAHRRLSIIDLSRAGHQPMLAPGSAAALVYNGELYNYRELRTELEGLGHSFVSRSDSEVLLHAYLQWGERCLDRFNGMFAFAIWDRNRQELFLARDRYGVKPLYYSLQGSRFLFASEQKALLEHPAMHRAVDLEALVEYFTFQNLFTDRTLLEGVRTFPAGCWARVSLGSVPTTLRTHRYWDFRYQEPERPASDQEYLDEMDALFRAAVQRQLVSDVEVGAYLSGGMDSGSITAVAARNLPNLTSFTVGFDLHSASGLELGFDERVKAELMSYLFKTSHYEMVLKAGDMQRSLPAVAWHLEEPRVGQSYPNYYAAQLVSKFVKVVLSGAGGDELFGGYPWRYYRAADDDSFENYIDKYYAFWQRLLSAQEIRDLFAPVFGKVEHVDTRDIFRGVFQVAPSEVTRPEDYIHQSLYFEAKTFLHGLLVVEDKLSMAHGLESRVPFLDNDLVDFAMRVPARLKVSNLGKAERLDENHPGPKIQIYFQRSGDGKVLMRRLMERYLPPEITQAAKQGFSAPDASWFKGESIDYVRETLYEKDAYIYSYFDRAAVVRLVDDHLQGRQNRRLLIWSLLNFEWFLRKFIR